MVLTFAQTSAHRQSLSNPASCLFYSFSLSLQRQAKSYIYEVRVEYPLSGYDSFACIARQPSPLLCNASSLFFLPCPVLRGRVSAFTYFSRACEIIPSILFPKHHKLNSASSVFAETLPGKIPSCPSALTMRS